MAAESDDQVALAEFRPCPAAETAAECGAHVTRTYPVGLIPSDIEGPHGVAVSPSGRVMYVSLAHGRPNGLLQKYSLETGQPLGEVELGMFPASLDVTADGGTVWVINFNFDDPDMKPSSVSVVDGATMLETARIQTCRMPHGSRLSPDGTKHYSGCMMDDLLVEVDTRTRAVSRTLSLRSDGHAAAATSRDSAHRDHLAPVCSPTWTQPSVDGAKVFVACNKSAEIVEVDAARWAVTRRWPTPRAPYNIAATPDGRLLVVTQKGPGTTTVWRISDAKLLAEIPGTGTVASGVAVSADGRYAFVTLEGKGGDPGRVDVIDLVRLAKVASVETGKQAGGIAVLPHATAPLAAVTDTMPAAVVQRFVDAANARDAESMAALVAPDAVFARFPDGRVIASGRDAIHAYYARLLLTLSPDFRITVQPRIVEGHLVIDQEQFAGLPAEQGQATWMYEVHGGLIHRAWVLDGRRPAGR